MNAFADYAAYYDLLYRDKDYAAETAFVVSQLRRHAPAASSILELGCGTGVHGLALAAAGYRVDGVDLSNEMLVFARRRRAAAAPETAARISFERGDIRSLATVRTYDAATSLFHVMSYQVEDGDLSQAIDSVRRHLRRGSPFIFDFWYGPAVLASGPSARSKEVENETYRVVRRGEPIWERQRDLVNVRYHVSVMNKLTGKTQEFDEDHPVRYFFAADLERRLNVCGFRVEACCKWLTDQPATEDTFSAYIVAIAE
jgi:SAM-dependent methyltransferase